MAHINIPDANEFSLLLNELSSDITYAHFHYKLLRSLQGAIEGDQYKEVFHQSWTFWHLTLEAHKVAMLLRLGRIFDQEKSALSIGNWLQTIKSNLYFFDKPNFSKRLQGNSFVESLAKNSRKPSEKELDQEIGTVLVKLNKKGAADKVVKKFVATRDKFLAHKDPNFLLPSRGPKKVADLSWNDVEHLLSLANRLLTKYSLLFAASAYSTTMHGQDDYKYVLETIKKRIESHKADEEADMKKYLRKSK